MKYTNPVLIFSFFMVLLALPVTAHAAWGNEEIHPVMGPNFNPAEGQAIHHETQGKVSSAPARVNPQHRVQPTQSVHPNRPASKPQTVRPVQPVNHPQVTQRRKPAMPNYFRHDADYYGYQRVPFPSLDVDADSPFVVPDGFETVTVNGETFYYNQGVFYQEVNAQLAVIPAVLGAVVDYIPQDYQIVMVDGVHYLFTSGVYYQRVDQGFEVVQPPESDQE